MNTLRILIFAACFRRLKRQYPAMFDTASAAAAIEAAIADTRLENA